MSGTGIIFTPGSALNGPSNGASLGDAVRPVLRYNRVTWRADGGGPRIYLTLEGAWKRRVGLAPDINHALVPWTEFAKLGQDPGQYGTIEFWYRSDPQTAVNTRPVF